MRSKPAICYNTTQCCLIYAFLIVVIRGTSTPSTPTPIELNDEDERHNLIESIESSTTIGTHYANASVNAMHGSVMSTKRGKSRSKRSIIQLAGMIRCVSGCDPFSYKSYGCYCGYLGAGRPVDLIDRCCLEHDWCYTYAACPQILIYFVPYQWSCITPGYAQCGVVPFGGITEQCSYQLCQCDRAFAKCLSQNPCPISKPICQSSPIIAIQNIIVG